MARIDHLTGGIHRISTYAPEKRISFNQFLIDDNEPALIQLFTKWMTAFDDLSLRSPLPVRAFRPRPLWSASLSAVKPVTSGRTGRDASGQPQPVKAFYLAGNASRRARSLRLPMDAAEAVSP
jgi:hypothetical protein